MSFVRLIFWWSLSLVIHHNKVGLYRPCTVYSVHVHLLLYWQMALVYTELATGKWQTAMDPAGQLLVSASVAMMTQSQP